MVAFCAGVGGSLLLIGSAPGVALMSLEGISFGWYLKRVTVPSLIAYLISVYLII
jgi:Na+/H+ antiporter NhaD/arsenite permease-like protein